MWVDTYVYDLFSCTIFLVNVKILVEGWKKGSKNRPRTNAPGQQQKKKFSTAEDDI